MFIFISHYCLLVYDFPETRPGRCQPTREKAFANGLEQVEEGVRCDKGVSGKRAGKE